MDLATKEALDQLHKLIQTIVESIARVEQNVDLLLTELRAHRTRIALLESRHPEEAGPQ